MDPRTRIDVEPRVPPAPHHPDEVLVDLAPGQEHPQYLVPEKRFQILQVEFRGDPESSPTEKTAIRAEHVAMRVKALGKVPKHLDGNDRAGECGGFGNCGLEEAPQLAWKVKVVPLTSTRPPA
jgi:hypothetical protein